MTEPELKADTPAILTPKAGYKTTEFWLTLASVLVGTVFLFGGIGPDTKDNLTSALQHGVESVFLLGGQVILLCRYIKSRKETKMAEDVKRQKEEHDKLIAELKIEQQAAVDAQIAAIKAEYELKLEEAKKKKPATRRRKSNG